jgi:hypothetical protein
VNAEQLRSCLLTHRLRDSRTPITALRDEPGVSEPLHQHHPSSCDADGIPPGARRLSGEPVARQRWNHQIKRIRCFPAMRRGIGQRLDNLQLLNDRARPPVRDDQRQRVLMPGANVNEVNVQPIDLGNEVR